MKEIPLDEFITFRLLHLTNRFNRQAVKILATHTGLRLPEWRCLAILGAYGPQQVNQISARLGADKGLISRSLTSLEKSGHVKMKRNTGDRRQILVTLTAKGKKTMERMMPIMRRRQGKLVKSLTRQEWKMLDKIVAKLHQASMLIDEEIGLEYNLPAD